MKIIRKTAIHAIEYIWLTFLCLPLIMGCSSDDIVDSIPDDWITLSTQAIDFPYEGGSEKCNYTLAKGIDVSQLKSSISSNGEDWCTVTIEDSKLIVQSERSFTERERSTVLTLLYDDTHKSTINIKQAAAPSSADKLIKVVGGEATSEETSGKDADGKPLTMKMSYDGDKKTYFNSKFGAVSYPFYLTYELEEGHTLNSIVYTPRTDSGNKWGSFDEFSVEVSTADKPDEFIPVETYARGNGVHSSFTMRLKKAVSNVKKVRFTITKAYENRVSCAEMEFYEASSNKFDPSSVFEDALCTKLKNGVTEKQIKQIPNEYLKGLGLALLAGDYDSSYRLADYRPYQHPSVMSGINKTSKYSLRDNPTGIYAKSGETLVVLVGSIYKGGKVSMLIQDLNGGYNNSKTYNLEEGYNEIKVEVGGLIYILNHVNDAIPLLLENADSNTLKVVQDKSVQIHFAMGKVNGYFDILKNKEADWAKIRDNAKYQDIDVLGKYAHITWRISDFKKYNTEITKTIDNCDRLVYLQEDFMGLVKYNKMFNNRMHFCIDYKAVSPNASDYRTVYNASDYYAEPFCKPDRFAARCWGPAHEVGHCNQTRPGLKWAGLTEVTNNIMSLHIQTSFGEPCKLVKDNCSPTDEDGNQIQGSYNNIYEASIELIVKGSRSHCLPNIDKIVRETQLVPFWQLRLYIMEVCNDKDFFRDLYEMYRVQKDKTSTTNSTEGVLQLEFVSRVCDLARIDFTQFFEDWGFLRPVEASLNDYSIKKIVVTQAEIDALKAEIAAKGYPKAPNALYKITDTDKGNYNKPNGYVKPDRSAIYDFLK